MFYVLPTLTTTALINLWVANKNWNSKHGSKRNIFVQDPIAPSRCVFLKALFLPHWRCLYSIGNVRLAL